MKIFLRAFLFSGASLFAVAGISQTNPATAAPVPATPAAAGAGQTAPVAAPVSSEMQLAMRLAAAQAKLMDWPQLGRYSAENAALAAPAKGEPRVVFYGDSITDAWGHRPATWEFFPGKPYLDRGISGQTTPQMVVRFHQDVVDLHPGVVVILAGTNDVAGNTGPMTPEMTEGNFRAMVEMARGNGIKVVITSILPAGDFPWKRGMEPAPKIRALNQWLQDYCKSEGIVYVDYYSALADENGAMKAGLSADGVHPNATGYAIMAPLAEAGIQKALGK
jgi:lysophospholipase L1-like esterase